MENRTTTQVPNASVKMNADSADEERNVCFLGYSGAGKTSLIERMMYGRFPNASAPTRGVRLLKWKTEANHTPMVLRIWDFGGQEVMRQTLGHFFISRAAYVIVCPNYGGADWESEKIVSRWLDMVHLFAPGCPAIVAMNKADINDGEGLNEWYLREKSPEFQGLFYTSAKVPCNAKYGTNALLQAIKTEVVNRLPCLNINSRWQALKRALETSPRHWIAMEDYRRISVQCGVVERNEQSEALAWLKGSGVVFYDGMKARENSQEIPIFKTARLINGIGNVILATPPVALLSRQTIFRVTENSKAGYNQEEMEYILQIMNQLEISLNIRNSREFIPVKLREMASELAERFPKEGSLHLRWRAPYLPEELIHRLAIRKYAELSQELFQGGVWRSGGIFQRADTICRALAELNDRQFDVYVTGAISERRKYMESFRLEILRIAEELNVQAEEIICYSANGEECEITCQDVMEQLYRKPNCDVYLPGVRKYLSPKKLLEETYYNYMDKFNEYRKIR